MDAAPTEANESPEPEARGTIDVTEHERTSRRPGTSRGLVVAAGIGLLLVFAMQIFTLVSASRTGEQIAALDARIEAIDSDVSDVQASVSVVDQKVDDLTVEALVAPAASGASAATAPAEPAGILPPFEQGRPDAALGVKLGDVTGVEYYTGKELTFDPSDGTPRAWLIWAHWCPHCQRELPAVTDWYSENADDYPDVELVSITGSIDPDRGNPLEPYLNELKTPFPVLVDSDSLLAQQLGVNAFPFWVFTAGDGTTVLRVAGYLEIDQVASIFDQLETLAS